MLKPEESCVKVRNVMDYYNNASPKMCASCFICFQFFFLLYIICFILFDAFSMNDPRPSLGYNTWGNLRLRYLPYNM